jgi:hypothetical protein
MPHLFYFSTGQGPSTHPSGFSPEEKAVEYGPHGLVRLGGNVQFLSNRIVSSQSQSQSLRSHFEGSVRTEEGSRLAGSWDANTGALLSVRDTDGSRCECN